MAYLDFVKAWWELSDLTDEVGSNALTNGGGLSFVAASDGNGVQGDGTNSLTIAASAGGDLVIGDNDFWINMWANWPAGDAGSEKILLSLANTDLQIKKTNTERLQFFINHDAPGNATAQVVGPYASGQWHNIHAYWSKSSERVVIRVNDVDQGTKNNTGNIPLDRTTTLHICGHNLRTAGIIDNVIVGKGGLPTSGEITTLYNSGSALSYSEATGGGSSSRIVKPIGLRQGFRL